MTKPLDQFGGWLKFFLVIQWINIVICGLTVLIALLTMITAETFAQALEPVFLFFYSIMIILLCLRIVKALKIKAPETPGRIIKLLTWVLSAAFIYAILEWSYYYFSQGPSELSTTTTKSGGDVIRILIWYAIWTSYFKKSARVAKYYGLNTK